ncbi:MAG: RNA polymerase sigma factor [Leptolyngbyaceae cyanobacterium]
MNEAYQQLEILNDLIKQMLLRKGGRTSKNLMLLIRRSLTQMRLHYEWDESEILVDAYMRTRKQILAGEIIENLPGYLTRVCQLIVLEKNRQRKRHHNISQKLSSLSDAISSPKSTYEEGVSNEVISSLWSSFNALSKKERQVLTLRIVKGYSWREIAYQLVEWGVEKNYNDALVAKLRKQGERALEKLRRKILSLDR